MDAGCLRHCLTEAESQKFERDGFFIVHDAVPLSWLESWLLRLIASIVSIARVTGSAAMN